MERLDAALLVAAAEGDADAYAEFFRRHVRAITGYAVRRCHGPEDVSDLVSDTFMIALQAANRYVPETDSALPWLFGIARRVLARQRRRRASFTRLLVKSSNAQPRFQGIEEDAIADAIDAHRQSNRLADAMAQLSDGERDVLELIAYEGLSPTEAAVALDLTPNAARLKLSRARRRMRVLLGEGSASTSPEFPYAT